MAVYDVPAKPLIDKAAEELKKTIKMPVWAAFVKTGNGKERVPSNPDWWYIRSAAILRKVYMMSPIGTNQLSLAFANKKNRGTRPEHLARASRKIIRVVLQQLEKEGYVKQEKKGVHKGRVITGKGKSFLDKISKTLA
ncbi:MAG: 30S ribosomal protein S19e [Nanoarchaeota archaeon]|nr:30S ribosomal protein S19e [Nanoarchaeota archaeon]